MPDTLAQRVRAKYPGVYDDLNDQQLEAKVTQKYPGVYDDVPKSTATPAAPAAAPAMSVKDQFLAKVADAGRMDDAQRLRQAEFGPAVGGALGGMVGGMPGAAIGGAIGEAGRQMTRRELGAPSPASALGQATDIVKAGAAQGALEGAGQAIGAVARKGASYLMNRATSRVSAQLSREFPELGDTLIDNAISVSQGGLDKARMLLKVAKSKATMALKGADEAGAMVPVQLTPDVAEILKTAVVEHAIKSGALPKITANGPVTMASARLTGPMKELFGHIDNALANGTALDLKPSLADLLKTQVQKESRALYLNRVAQNGQRAMSQAATELGEFASRLNDAIDGVASGYKAGNAEAKPLIGAVRGVTQAIRPSGNLYQAMLRPAVGAAFGEEAGRHTGHPIAGAVIGGALTSPAGMSRAAILLADPIMQAAIRQMPKTAAAALTTALSAQELPPQPSHSAPRR